MKLIDNTGLSYLIGKIKTMIGLKADKTYVDNKVKTDVPENAVFTDTIVDISGKADKAYVDNKVKTDVPAGAKFTDTVYTHPTTAGNKHIPTGGANGQVLKYSASGTATWQADSDTITTINGKTGAITKADITALGVPAQDTIYEHPATHSADMIVDGSANKAFTATEKTKLAGVATGANKYTHPANHPPSIITQDASNRFVTDTEKAAWSGKADKTYVDNKVETDTEFMVGRANDTTEGIIPGSY